MICPLCNEPIKDGNKNGNRICAACGEKEADLLESIGHVDDSIDHLLAAAKEVVQLYAHQHNGSFAFIRLNLAIAVAEGRRKFV